MIWRKRRTPQERLKVASHGSEIEYCRTVCALADEAAALLDEGKDQRALELFKVIAELDIDEKAISPVVDHARRILEDRGIPTSPSVETEYQRYLEGLPPHQRNLMLARQCIRRISSHPDAATAAAARQEAIAYFEKAAEHGPLGKKDQRIYLGLKRGAAQQGDGAD